MADFTNILALDTAMGGCTACAAAGDRVVSRSAQMPRGQAEHLVPFAQEVMQGVELAYEQLDAILCTIGPGAFTGLRIGMSAARAFGLSHDTDRKSTRLNSSHDQSSYAVFCLKKKHDD